MAVRSLSSALLRGCETREHGCGWIHTRGCAELTGVREGAWLRMHTYTWVCGADRGVRGSMRGHT
eukprot:2784175-Pyramimonas_sp.AAC.1